MFCILSTCVRDIAILILAGGSGKRLWPFVDANMPKFLFRPFSTFTKKSGNKTLLENTISFAKKLVPENHIFILTTQNQKKFVYGLVSKSLYKNVLIEPDTKDTAFALIYGAFKIFQRLGRTFLLNLATDHIVSDINKFKQGIDAATKHKEFLYLFTSPIKFPSIHHGYVKLGEKILQGKTSFIYKVDRFIEKPKIEQAASFAESKSYRWNCGIFFWYFTTFMQECKKVKPLFNFLHKIANGNVKAAYSLKSPGSIEFSLLQKTKILATPYVNINWADIGTWENVVDFIKDKSGNYSKDVLNTYNAENVNIFGDFNKIKVMGLKDVIIVKNKNNLLVSKYGQTFHIKNII